MNAHKNGQALIAPFLRGYVIQFVTVVPAQLIGTVFSASITHKKTPMMPVFVRRCGKDQAVILLYKSTVLLIVTLTWAVKAPVTPIAKAAL